MANKNYYLTHTGAQLDEAIQKVLDGYVPSSEVDAARDEGYDEGYDIGHDAGYESGYNAGFAEGGGGSKPYIELPYIESTGTQYIDTGFKPNQNTRVVADCDLMAQGTVYTPFGTWNDANVGQYICLSYTGMPSSLYHGNAYKVGTTSLIGRHTIDANKGTLYLDGKLEVTCDAATYSCLYPLYLFTLNDKGKPRDMNMSHMKLYACQIYNNGTLIRDYIPVCYYTGEIGLYDLVNGKFYGNAGTDKFNAGTPTSIT